MAGLTHSALRSVLASFGGVGLFSTEMLSARRLPSENPALSPYLIRTGNESPLSYQLLVTAPGEVAGAIDALHAFGADAIDLNLGCPAPAIRRAGGGGSLMLRGRQVRDIVRAARQRTRLPLTAKIRLGPDLDMARLRDFCLLLQEEGIDLLTVHARMQKEKFCRPPRWQWVGYVKEWLTIPVVANGSVFSAADARACLEVSGADGLMIGRAAPQSPWLFAEIAREVYGCPLPGREVVLEEIFMDFAGELAARFPVERRLGRLKEFTHYFARNFAYGHHLASAVQAGRSLQEAVEAGRAFFNLCREEEGRRSGKLGRESQRRGGLK
jgi:tRNA-dihydrouridine synthase